MTVVRNMTFGYSTLARVGGVFNVQLKANNSRVWSIPIAASTTGSENFYGYLVLPPGEQLRISSNATGSLWFTASGYQLSLP
jgi:hypothetical protein